MSHVVYGDFTSPLSHLASHRLDTAGLTGAQWRAVTHRHGLPRVSLRLSGAAARQRRAELDRVRDRLRPGEELPGQAPPLLPNPDAPNAAYAEAVGTGHEDEVRRVLFHAYWVDGSDIGDPEVLRRLLPPVLARRPYTGDRLRDFGYAVSPAGAPLSTAAAHRLRDWQREWLALGTPVTLALATGEDVAVDLAAVDLLAPQRQLAA